MDAAEKYFALEQYLTPDEFGRLDENSTVIYVAEYYYGIAEQRKVDLAVRRVHKLIKLTQENDRMRAEHNAGALAVRLLVRSCSLMLAALTALYPRHAVEGPHQGSREDPRGSHHRQHHGRCQGTCVCAAARQQTMRPHSRLRLQRRIAEFYEYKTKDKGVILAEQLKLEALFNNLAMRLAHHKRPEYVPPPGCSLKVPYPIPRSLVLSRSLTPLSRGE